MSENELRDFTNSLFNRPSPADEQDDLEVDDQQDEQQAAEGAEQDDAEALPAGWNEFVDSLTPDEITRAQGDADWAEYAFGLWLTREDAKATFEAANHPVDTGEAPDEPMPATGAEVIDWVYAHAAEIRRDHGVGPAEYLASIAGAGRAEWRRFANEAGIPLDAKPSYGSLPSGAQAAVVRADVANWTAEDFRK